MHTRNTHAMGLYLGNFLMGMSTCGFSIAGEGAGKTQQQQVFHMASFLAISLP